MTEVAASASCLLGDRHAHVRSCPAPAARAEGPSQTEVPESFRTAPCLPTLGPGGTDSADCGPCTQPLSLLAMVILVNSSYSESL